MPRGVVQPDEARTAHDSAGAGKWVMLALAGPEVFKLVFEASSRGGFRLLTAKSPAEFQRRLRIVIPDLILLDSHHPTDVWLDVLQIAKADAPQVPVLALMEPGSTEPAHLSVLSGSGEVLVKPVAPGLLSRRINDVLLKA